VRGEKRACRSPTASSPNPRSFFLATGSLTSRLPSEHTLSPPAFDGAGTRRSADEHAHRSAAVREPSPQMIMTGRREPVICSDYLIKAQGRQKTKGGGREIHFDDEQPLKANWDAYAKWSKDRTCGSGTSRSCAPSAKN
jgi:hypothetical protein